MNESLVDFTTDLIPFITYYIALLVRVLDNKAIFISLFFNGSIPTCERFESEGCPLDWENPLAKAHHEFIFINISASLIILIRFILKAMYYSQQISLTFIFISFFYLFYSIIILILGLMIKWTGIDSLFFSLIAMSIPYFCIFSLSNYWDILVLGFPLPFFLGACNGIFICVFMIAHAWYLKMKKQ